jgi:hypothetical protein
MILSTKSVNDEDIIDAIKTMLNLLATFQARLKANDPLNAKRKARYVLGLKQVTFIAYLPVSYRV